MKAATKHTFKILEGYDHFNDYPLFNIIGLNNDYVGEWHTTREEAQTELNELTTN